MKTLKKATLLLFILFTSIISFGTTWDEPWQDQVIQEADYFVFGEIIKNDEHEGFTLRIKRKLAGDELPNEIKVSNFYLLKLCSRSGGHGPEFRFPDSAQFYFFS